MIVKESVKAVYIDAVRYDIDEDTRVQIEVDEDISIKSSSMSTYGSNISINTQQLDVYLTMKGIPFGLMVIFTNNSRYAPSLNFGETGWKRL